MSWKQAIAVMLALAICSVGLSAIATAAEGTKVELTGKAVHKDADKNTGAKMICAITVTSAKGSDGTSMNELKGKTINVTGGKMPEIQKNNGKDVVAKGTLSADGKSLAADSVTPVPSAKEPIK